MPNIVQIDMNIASVILLLFFINSSVNAGQLFRFSDNGVTVISQSLPAGVVKTGYQILDSKSLRVIKSFPPLIDEQLVEQASTTKKEHKDKSLLSAKVEKQIMQIQKLVAIYGSEEGLIDQRNIDLENRQIQIDKVTLLLERGKQNYRILQNKASEQRLINSGKISDNLKKMLQKTAREIANNQSVIDQLKSEMGKRKKQYEIELMHFKTILTEENVP